MPSSPEAHSSAARVPQYHTIKQPHIWDSQAINSSAGARSKAMAPVLLQPLQGPPRLHPIPHRLAKVHPFPVQQKPSKPNPRGVKDILPLWRMAPRRWPHSRQGSIRRNKKLVDSYSCHCSATGRGAKTEEEVRFRIQRAREEGGSASVLGVQVWSILHAGILRFHENQGPCDREARQGGCLESKGRGREEQIWEVSECNAGNDAEQLANGLPSCVSRDCWVFKCVHGSFWVCIQQSQSCWTGAWREENITIGEFKLLCIDEYDHHLCPYPSSPKPTLMWRQLGECNLIHPFLLGKFWCRILIP